MCLALYALFIAANLFGAWFIIKEIESVLLS